MTDADHTADTVEPTCDTVIFVQNTHMKYFIAHPWEGGIG